MVSIEPESQSSALQDAFARLAEAALPSPFMSQVCLRNEILKFGYLVPLAHKTVIYTLQPAPAF